MKSNGGNLSPLALYVNTISLSRSDRVSDRVPGSGRMIGIDSGPGSAHPESSGTSGVATRMVT